MIFFTIVLIIIIALLIYEIKNVNKIRNLVQVSNNFYDFNNDFENTQLPLFKLNINNESLYFLVDTGATINMIDENVLKEIKPNYKEETLLDNDIISITGVKSKNESIVLTFFNDEYKQQFKENFVLIENCEAFEIMSKDSGKKVCGILGTDFIEKYKFIINFKNKRISYN